jgi:hypothetical protein
MVPLHTSPEHYRVHNCHTKSTRKERLTDTIQFRHKNITNPTISHADKVMKALADCAAVLKGIQHLPPKQQFDELKSIVTNLQTSGFNEHNVATSNTSSSKQTTQTVPRVPENTAAVPRVVAQSRTPPPIVQPTRSNVERNSARRRRSMAAMNAPIHLSNQPPALSTRSKVKAATMPTTPVKPIRRERRQSQLCQPTNYAVKRQLANAVSECTTTQQQFRRTFTTMTQDIERAMAVMDKNTGKLFNYRQLLKHPAHKKEWDVSAANEFG